MLCWIFFTIEWQASFNPVNDSVTELTIYLSIPPEELRFITNDSIYSTHYEIQLKIFDEKKNQVAGDYWIRNKEKDTLNIIDSVKINLPGVARSFNLRVIDLQAQEILNVYEKIRPIKFLANIRYLNSNDTLFLRFTVINKKGLADRITVVLEKEKKEVILRGDNYDDSLVILTGGIPVGRYSVKFIVSSAGKKIDEVNLPVEISRPFYQDDKLWRTKVVQLEYIATPNEIARLKSAAIEERDSLWRQFWKQHDPTPNTEFNEKEVEYFERIDYAEKNFSFCDKGWRSDRGRIYVKYGPPDEIQSRPYEIGTKPYEVWLYYRLNLKFIFYDRYGFGEYILLNPEGDRI